MYYLSEVKSNGEMKIIASADAKKKPMANIEFASGRQNYMPQTNPSMLPKETDHDGRRRGKMKPLQLNPAQSKFIADTMNELSGRAKRQKTNHVGSTHRPATRTLSGSNEVRQESLATLFADSGRLLSRRCSDDDLTKAKRFDILAEVDAHPDAVTIVATSGGLITHCKSCNTFANLYLRSFVPCYMPYNHDPVSL